MQIRFQAVWAAPEPDAFVRRSLGGLAGRERRGLPAAAGMRRSPFPGGWKLRSSVGVAVLELPTQLPLSPGSRHAELSPR